VIYPKISQNRPHYESSFFIEICCPLCRLHLQASFPSMNWRCFHGVFGVFGLPPFLFSGKVPWIMLFSRDLSLPRVMWPKCLNFLLFTFASKLLLTPACSKTHEFVWFAVRDTRRICLNAFISNVSNLSSSWRVQKWTEPNSLSTLRKIPFQFVRFVQSVVRATQLNWHFSSVQFSSVHFVHDWCMFIVYICPCVFR